MKWTEVLKIFPMILVAVCTLGQNDASGQANPQIKLWAAIGVPKPVFQLAEAEKMTLSFVVVNDGQAVVDPDVESSHLFINGAEPQDWNFIIHNGLRGANFKALPPGQTLEFAYQLGPRYFAAPAIYSVRWKGPNFNSPEITFRVMP